MSEMMTFASILDVDVAAWYYRGDDDYSSYSPDDVDYSLRILARSDAEYAEIMRASAPKFSPDDNRCYLQTCVPFILQLSRDYLGTNEETAMGRRVADFLNHHIRVVERIFLLFGLPRFRLDGRPLLRRNADDHWKPLMYTTRMINYEEIFWEYSLMG